MSIEVTSLVISRQIGSPSKKVVLMIMADAANPDGTGVWISKPNIAKRSEVSLKTVKRVIQDMLDDDIIFRRGKHKNSNGFTTIYDLNLDKITGLSRTQIDNSKGDIDTGQNDPRDTVTPDTGQNDPSGGSQRPPTQGHSDPQTVHEPSLNHNTHSNAREAADLFEKVKSAWCLMAAKNGLPSVEIITPLRVGWIEKRLSDCRGDTAAIFKAIENVPHDNHRLGFSKGGWRADFDWVFGNQQNFLKCLESKPQTETQKQRSENGTQRSNNPSSRIARIGEKRREAGRRAVEQYKAKRVAEGL